MVGSHWRLNVFDFFQIGNRRAINSTNPLPTPQQFSSRLPPLSSRYRRPWPFELNSNFNAFLHIQAHYSRLPTYSEPTQSLLNCAFLICRRVQLWLPPLPLPPAASPAWLQKIESRHFAKLRAATELRRIWQRASRLEMDCECRSELRLGSHTHTRTHAHSSSESTVGVFAESEY